MKWKLFLFLFISFSALLSLGFLVSAETPVLYWGEVCPSPDLSEYYNSTTLNKTEYLILNSTGLIKDWNATGFISNQTPNLTTYIRGNMSSETITTNTTNVLDGLILHYKMNDNAADYVVEDSSGSGNNGTATSTTDLLTTTGTVNGALDLSENGGNQYITMTNTIVFGEDATINAWVKDWSVGGAILGNTVYNVDRVLFFYDGDSNWYIGSNTFPEQVAWSSSGIDLSGWHMFTVKKSGTTVELFIDTVSQGQRTLSTIGDVNFIGYSQYGLYDYAYINEVVDDVRIYNKTLSNNEILQLYNETYGTEENTFNTSTTALGAMGLMPYVTANNFLSSDNSMQWLDNKLINIWNTISQLGNSTHTWDIWGNNIYSNKQFVGTSTDDGYSILNVAGTTRTEKLGIGIGDTTAGGVLGSNTLATFAVPSDSATVWGMITTGTNAPRFALNTNSDGSFTLHDGVGGSFNAGLSLSGGRTILSDYPWTDDGVNRLQVNGDAKINGSIVANNITATNLSVSENLFAQNFTIKGLRGLSANYSLGSCWQKFTEGVLTATNCTTL